MYARTYYCVVAFLFALRINYTYVEYVYNNNTVYVTKKEASSCICKAECQLNCLSSLECWDREFESHS
jgi:hypothetical protein